MFNHLFFNLNFSVVVFAINSVFRAPASLGSPAELHVLGVISDAIHHYVSSA